MSPEQAQTVADIRNRRVLNALNPNRGVSLTQTEKDIIAALQIIDSQAAEIERLTKDRDEARANQSTYDPLNVVAGGPGAPGYDYDDET